MVNVYNASCRNLEVEVQLRHQRNRCVYHKPNHYVLACLYLCVQGRDEIQLDPLQKEYLKRFHNSYRSHPDLMVSGMVGGMAECRHDPFSPFQQSESIQLKLAPPKLTGF